MNSKAKTLQQIRDETDKHSAMECNIKTKANQYKSTLNNLVRKFVSEKRERES